MHVFSGSLLKQQRLDHDVRVEAVAVAADRSAPSIIAYERGIATPPADVVGRMADAIGCEVADFYEVVEEVAA